MPNIHIDELVRRGQDIQAAQQAARQASRDVAAQLGTARPPQPQPADAQAQPEQAAQ